MALNQHKFGLHINEAIQKGSKKQDKEDHKADIFWTTQYHLYGTEQHMRGHKWLNRASIGMWSFDDEEWWNLFFNDL